MDEQRCFVQFIHPGGEHQPDKGDLKFWNRVAHRRKFLRSPGRYLHRGQARGGEIVFWGEWEPESRVVRRYAGGGPDRPDFLYELYYVDHRDGVRRQNTDPFVFGDAFHYTGCMQHTTRGPTQLRFLAHGSLVLFGSCRDRSRFVVDTVLVVADFVDHSATDQAHTLHGKISQTYRTVTIDPWYRGSLPKGQSHRLYFGATPERRVGEMFSFFPCRPHDEDEGGFARPEIQLPDYITPNLTQGKKIKVDLGLPELTVLWQNIANQVELQGLALGVAAELPPKHRDEGGRIVDSESIVEC